MMLIKCDNPECDRTYPVKDVPGGIAFPESFIRLRSQDNKGNPVRVDACRRACLPGASRAKDIPGFEA